MKPLVIYHANCADGFGAAFAAWLKLGDDAEYLPMQYGDIDTQLDYTGRELYILDFSFPREVMEHMFTNAKRVVWLDHHATGRPYAEEKCGGYINSRTERHSETYDIVHDNNKSGAMIAWEYFHPDTEVPMLIQHIDDYDRWQFQLDGTKAFNKALWSYAPWSFEQWKAFMSRWTRTPLFDEPVVPTEFYSEFLNEGRAILRAHDQNVQSVVKGSVRKCHIVAPELGPNLHKYGLVANCPPFLTSDVGHELANQSGTFGLCWTLSREGMIAKCSLRSNGDYDVSAIAKAFGGGGHKNAAGFEVPLSTLIEWLK